MHQFFLKAFSCSRRVVLEMFGPDQQNVMTIAYQPVDDSGQCHGYAIDVWWIGLCHDRNFQALTGLTQALYV